MRQDLYTLIAQQIFPGSVVSGHRPLEGGVSASMHAVELELRNGQVGCFVVRQHGTSAWKSRGHHVTATEFELLRALFNKGTKVPQPLYLDCSGSVLDSPFLVTEFVNGSTSVHPDDLTSHLEQMAGFLVSLHDLEPAEIELPDLPSIEDPVAGVLSYLGQLDPNNSWLSTLGSLTAKTNLQRLLHGDFWPGNVVWNNGRLAAVIDWEDASLGNPMADLACCRVELMCEYGSAAMETFTDFYLGSGKPDTTDLPLWETFVSSSALVTMPDWGLAPEDEARRKKQTSEFLKESLDRLLL